VAEKGFIEVVLPEGATCERTPDEMWEMPELRCLVPMLAEGEWHDKFEGHLGRVVLSTGELGYVTWWGNGQPMERPEIVDPR
jgi:hypothetical protein